MGFVDRVKMAGSILVGSGGTSSGSGTLADLIRSKDQVGRGRTPQEMLAAYSQSPWLHAVVNKVSFSVASNPWRLYRPTRQTSGARRSQAHKLVQRSVERDGMGARRKTIARLKAEGEVEEVDEHPFLDLIYSGNDFMTGSTVRQLNTAYQDVVGEAFQLIERDGSGAPVALLPIPRTWVKSIATPDAPYFEVKMDSYEEKVPASDMVYFQRPDLRNPYGRGIGTAGVLVDELNTDEMAAKHTAKWFTNSARPDILVYGKGLNPEETARLERKWRSKFGGFKNAFEPAFFSNEIGVKELNQTFQSMQLKELRAFERDTIIQVYGVSPEIFGIVENSNRACHSDDTECLTRDGWKLHGDLTFEDEIATWNEVAGRVEYHKPSKIVRYPYEGPMHHWKTRSVDTMVTPDHRMWVKTQTNGEYHIRRSHDLAAKKLQMRWRLTGGGSGGGQKFVTIPCVPYVSPGRRGDEPAGEGYVFNVHDFAPFLGYYIAEGSTDRSGGRGWRVRLHQNEGEVADRMREAAEHLRIGPVGVQVDARPERNAPLQTIGLSNKSLCAWLIEHVGVGAKNKRIPECVFDWPATAQNALLAAMMEGDGSTRQTRTKSDAEYADRYYGTASKALADDVQRLCVGIGLRSSIARRMKGEHEGWVVGISSKQEAYVTTSQVGENKRAPESPLREESYDGTVWCVEVPNHLFFTRRAGKVSLHGNTIEAADLLYGKWVLQPRLEYDCEVWQVRLLDTEFAEQGDGLILGYDSPVTEDKEYRLNTAKSAPWSIMVDEWREMMGFEPLPNGSGQVFMMPFNLVPQSSPSLGPDLPEEPEPEDDEEPEEEPEEEPAGDEEEGEAEEESRQVGNSYLDWEHFDGSASEAAARIRKDDEAEQPYLTDEDVVIIIAALSSEGLIEAMTPVLSDAISEFGEGAADEVGGEAGEWEVSPRVQNYLSVHAADKIRGINETTRDALRAALLEGVRAGEGIPKIRSRVSEVFEDASGRRATTIARTEVVGASNFGALEGYRQNGVPGKEWLETGDGDTRDTHVALGGQRVAVEEDFESPSGARGPAPGMLGRADEDIQCRCTLLPVIDMEQDSISGDTRKAYWRAFDRNRMPFERRLKSAARTEFEAQKDQILALVVEHFRERTMV